MNYIETYLAKNNFITSIVQTPHPELKICVVIPAFNEPAIIESLEALWNCNLPESAVEILIVINTPENSSIEIMETTNIMIVDVNKWIYNHQNEKIIFHIIERLNLPIKDAGVGLARKIGMDEAVNRLNCAGNDGIIAGFDADAVCDTNYLTELENHFAKESKSPGASIYYEHPLVSEDEIIDEGILRYELHLRYLIHALRFARYPFAFHTVGSSFAVRSYAYVKQGGMNKRRAGEDFYFLQKIITLGNFTEINSSRIIPSSRLSNRVPFGTGASMNKWITEQELTTYHLNAYKGLAQLTSNIEILFTADDSIINDILDSLPEPLMLFMLKNDFIENLKSIRNNTASLKTFCDRFYRWFDAFQVIKYLNYSHEDFYRKNNIAMEAAKLLKELNIPFSDTVMDLLLKYRSMDRNGFNLNYQR